MMSQRQASICWMQPCLSFTEILTAPYIDLSAFQVESLPVLCVCTVV